MNSDQTYKDSELHQKVTVKALRKLPNIGKVLAERLALVGISTPQELLHTGSEEAFQKIRKIDDRACLDMLYALEGAIQNIRWYYLSPKRKTKLKNFYMQLSA